VQNGQQFNADAAFWALQVSRDAPHFRLEVVL
jgi:hypothetical protein